MRKILYALLLLPFIAQAQPPVTASNDSVKFTFTASDSLTQELVEIAGVDSARIVIDTSGDTVWQIGRTLKSVFSNTVTHATGIMTDTSAPYPKNANEYFVLKMTPILVNFSVDIWHEYETDSMHAGGIVEFSTDTGATWMNVADCGGIYQVKFYSDTDTLFTGEPAFTGRSAGQIHSQLYIVNCVGVRKTATTCMMMGDYGFGEFYLRFRFKSDTTTNNTLSGWKIDSIKVTNGICEGGVAQVNVNDEITLHPNPATSELNIASAGIISSVEITDIMGRAVYMQQHLNKSECQVNISNLPAGLYFAKVNGADVRKFVKE